MPGLSTQVIHHAEGQAERAAPLVTPIYDSTTFVFESAEEVRAYNEGRARRYLYSRYENPTVVAVEEKLALLERAEMALLFSSGMAASATTLLALLSPGDEIVVSSAIYGGTLHLVEDVLARYGVVVRFAGLEAFRAPASLLSERTRLVWFESPINPTLRCIDIEGTAQACRAHGVLSAVDNTFASPVNQQPLTLGVDLVMHSATKYLGGHSDITAGVIAGPAPLVDRIAKTRRLLGTVLDAQPAHLLGRSLKTLEVRVARHNASAAAVAQSLADDPRLTQVLYPGLASHPDHAIAARQMRGFGGVLCIDLGGSYDRAVRFYDSLEIFQRAASLGGVQSLCSLPVLTSQWGCSDRQLAEMGVTRGMARLSVGLENADDLVADLDRALAKSV